MFKNKKYNIISIRRRDFVFYMSVCLALGQIAQQFFSAEQIIHSFVIFVFLYFCVYCQSFLVIKKMKVQNLKVHYNLDEVSAALHENVLTLHDKVGDYYIFKTRNVISPNISISVKACGTTDCLILLRTCDVTWLEDSLKDSKL